METNDLYADLCVIQSEISVPKGRNNAFGGFKYRKAEDILEAVKPMLKPLMISITLTDDIVKVGEWVFVKATATISRGDKSISVSAYARHADEHKKMDAAQVTGSASSYARKYALNGLFAINDTDDPDETQQISPGVTPVPIPGMSMDPSSSVSVPGMPPGFRPYRSTK